MNGCGPTVSVCLPVYNGERFVGQAIASVLAQTLTDFELIVADNASVDGTEAICRDAASRDRRVRYLTADRNRGLAWNHNRACAQATGRYLLWLACDDILNPDYLRRCVAALEADPGAVLCFSNCYRIDGEGRVVGELCLENPGELTAPADRFDAILREWMCEAVCGVMRMNAVRRTRLHQGFADSDRVLLAELGLLGRFTKLEETLFSRRFHADAASATIDRWERSVIFDPGKAGRIICPWWLELLALARGVLRAPLTREERYRTLRYLYWWARAHKSVLLGDLRRGLHVLLRWGET